MRLAKTLVSLVVLLFLSALLPRCGGTVDIGHPTPIPTGSPDISPTPTVSPTPSHPPASLSYGSNPVTYHKGVAISPNIPSTSGGAPSSYAVSPSLPGGLSLDPVTGVVTGTPTEIRAAADYTVTASNTLGSTTVALRITVDLLAPTGLTYGDNPVIYVVGQGILPNVATVTGIDLTFSVTPSLPAGLSLHTTTGTITGTPTTVTAAADYTVKAQNASGEATAVLRITVNNSAPERLNYATNPVSYAVGRTIAPNLPNNGGGQATSYSVTPALPNGLSLNPTTGVLTGTPSTVMAAADYTVTATNTIGSTSVPLQIRVTSHARLWIPESTVRAIVPAGGTLYIGGDFTQIGPPIGYGVLVDPSTGTKPSFASWPEVNGQVHVAISDPATPGGYYIGGEFTRIGLVNRSRIARILPNGTVDPSWNPSCAGFAVYDILVSGGTVYVGGYFTTIGGQARQHIAAVSASTGLAVAGFNPGASDWVTSLALIDNTLYVGGRFTSIGGQTRNRIAALDGTTGAVVAGWNPNSDGNIYALQTSSNTVYAGGLFSNIGGENRNHLAALDGTTGLATSWNPGVGGVNPSVQALAAADGVIYAGGTFSAIGGQSRANLAALDAATGLVTSWNPGASSTVYVLTVSGGTLYAGGAFSTIGSKTRQNLAAISTSTGVVSDWDPKPNNQIGAIAVSGNSVFIGGRFSSLAGVIRNGIAALDTATGQPTSWNPDSSGAVHSLALSGNNLYVGGHFIFIGGQFRNKIAALDTSTGLATAFDPNANGLVRALTVSDGTVYAGGDFTTVGGQTRNRIAAVDATTGALTPFNANTNSGVYALAATGGTLYAGGTFTTIGGASRNRLAALDAAGTATSWNPNLTGLPGTSVYALGLHAGVLYATGWFTTVGGSVTRYNAAAFSLPGETPTPWDPVPAGNTYALALGSSVVYVGGEFQNIQGQSYKYVAASNDVNGTPVVWNAGANSFVRAVAASGTSIFVGGDFTTLGGWGAPYLGVVDSVTALP